MRDLVVSLVVFGAIPLILMRPHIGVLVWSWIGYMNPHRMSWGFAYNFPFAQIVGVALLGSLLFSKEPKKIPITPLTVVWFLFVMWMSFTTAFAMFPELAGDYLMRVLKIQVPVFITIMLFLNKERINALIWTIFISIGFFGIKGGIFTLATGGSYRTWGPDGTFIAGNNELALATLMVIPLAAYLRYVSDRRWIKHGLLIAMILMAISAIGSQSRGALLAGSAVLVFFWLKSNKKFMTAILAVFLVGGIFIFMPQSWHDRMSTIKTYEQDDSAMGRITAWKLAINIANDRIVGGGFQAFRQDAYEMYMPSASKALDAHSIYFKILGEHGYIGLLLFVILLFLVFRTGRRIEKLTKDIASLQWLNYLSRMVRVGLIAYVVGGAFLGLSYFDLPYHLIAILVIAEVIVLKHVVESKREQTKRVG